MKNLNKRYKRGVAKNISFYICVIFLTCVAVLMFLLFGTAVNGERAYINDFTSRNVLENGQFETFMEISDSDMGRLQEKYDLILEKQEYSDLKQDGTDHVIRVFKESKKINKFEITNGDVPQTENEIGLSESFVYKNNLDIGSHINLGGKDYIISGFCERPDYLFMVKNQTDSNSRPDAFGIGMLSEDGYRKLSDKSTYYSVVYNEQNDKDFRTELNDSFTTISYLPDYANHRITTPEDTVKQYESMVNAILPVLLLFVVAIIAVILGRKVYSEQKHIGTLMALGYKKSEIVGHYVLYSLIPGMIGELIGLGLTFLLVQRTAGEFFFKLERLPVDFHIEPPAIIIAMVLPVSVYVFSSVITVLKTMSVSITAMLSGNTDNKKQGGAFAESKMNFKRKYRFRTIFNKPARTVVIIAGLIVSGLIMAIAVMMNDSVKNYSDKIIDEIGSFEYEYNLKGFQTDEYDGAKELIADTLEIENSNKTVPLFGTDSDNHLINLKTISGETADLESGYYISEISSVIFGVKEGDVLKAYNVRTLEQYEIPVKGIIDNKAQSVIYTSRENARELLGIEEEGYNMLMSASPLDVEEDMLAATIEKNDMKEMIQNVISGMKMMIYIMFAFGMIICVITIYLMVNMIIEESTVTISMLKVLGYRNREINKITVNIYHVMVPVGTGLAFLGGWVITKGYYEAYTSVFQAYVPTYISLSGVFIFIGAMVFSYFISLKMLGKKIIKVNMSESLKDVRA